MTLSATHKRGTTFSRHGFVSVVDDEGDAVPMIGWEGASRIKTKYGGIIAECVFEWIDASQSIARISVADTSNWPICDANIDIMLMTPAGEWIATPTASFSIIENITDRWVP